MLTLNCHPPFQETKSQIPGTHATMFSAHHTPIIAKVVQHLFHCYQVSGKSETDSAYEWLGQRMTV